MKKLIAKILNSKISLYVGGGFLLLMFTLAFFAKNTKLTPSILITYGLTLFFFHHWLKQKDLSPLIFGVLWFSATILYAIGEYKANTDINEGGYIIPAKITDLLSSPRSGGGYVYYNFFVENEEYKEFTSVGLSIFKRLKVGDTILIIYSEKNLIDLPYKYFPSKDEIQTYKNGVYYKDKRVYFNTPADSLLTE